MRPTLIVLITLILLATVATGFLVFEFLIRPLPTVAEAEAVELNLRVPGLTDAPRLIRGPDGAYRFAIIRPSGATEFHTPEAFADLIYHAEVDHPWWERILNITSPWGIAWVAIGLLGQLAFTGRMIVQWLVSERAKRSVVPAIFWWMSLIGASMLLFYFIWRRDIVGVLGQGTGWLIYSRNLWLIYRRRETQPMSEDPGAEPSLSSLETE